MAGFRHVNDGQAAMDEERLGNDLLFHASTLTASSAVERDPPLVIRATMSQILKEAFQPLSLDRAGRKKNKTANAAHAYFTSLDKAKGLTLLASSHLGPVFAARKCSSWRRRPTVARLKRSRVSRLMCCRSRPW